VEATAFGTFGTPGAELVLNYQGTEVGRLAMDFMHHGIPMPAAEGRRSSTSRRPTTDSPPRRSSARATT
jgi:hypothetical protein